MLSLDPRTTALVLIDLQAGLLALPLAPHAGTAVVAAAERLGRRFAALGAPVLPVRISFAPDYADKPNQPIDQPMLLPDGGLPEGWSDLDPAIAALPAAAAITKRQWSAFHGTELDLQLRRRGVTTIVLGGIATNFGVESTARDAWQHNYAVVVAEDASTSLAADLHQMSVTRILPRCARVRSTEEILAALPEAA
jgi:nicotinamidase-related amidase